MINKELLKNESIPYPVESDLPKKFPTAVLERKSAQDYFIQNMDQEPSKLQNLYIVVFLHFIFCSYFSRYSSAITRALKFSTALSLQCLDEKVE